MSITKKRQGELSAHAETLMMGITKDVSTLTPEEVEFMIDYVLKTLGSEATAQEVLAGSVKYCKNPVIHHLNVSTTMDMRMIAIMMSTDEDEEPYDILSRDGVFSYVYNIDAPFCSELGYTFYRKNPAGRIRRVG